MLTSDSTELTKTLMAKVWPADRLWASVEEARADVEIFDYAGDSVDGVSTQDVSIPGPGGPLRVRVYRPEHAEGTLPGLMYFHGGGFVVGEIEGFDWLCGSLARRAAHTVVSVEYRRAPDHPFPAALEDVLAATTYVSRHAADFGIDAARMSVAGDSAGGNLAAVVSQLGRAHGLDLRHQVLMVPLTLPYADTPSMRDYGSGYYLTRDVLDWFMDHYLPEGRNQAHDPRCAPLLADDLSGLPPATVITAEFDPLRDEGERYARKLAGAGTPVVQQRMNGAFHLTAILPKAFPQATEEVIDLVSARLREAAETPPVS
ncbi:alpha/beta hydrolase [Streptomyces sp. NPDC046900]|uniref:alpha/beta hydrolase n=1 Tax=Streptomyces sp. NPDC046900 TaxID=3155473 RepID=UPI0033D278A3